MGALCHSGTPSATGTAVAAGALSGKVTAVTDDNDWRVTVTLHASEHVQQAMHHLSTRDVEQDVHRRLGSHVVVGEGDRNELYLYTHTKDAAAAAQQEVADLLGSLGLAAEFAVHRWHPVAEDWEAADVQLPGTPEAIAAELQRLDAEETSESLASGRADFEIRIELRSHQDAVALAARLTAEGYTVVRRWKFLIVAANNADDAAAFAAKIEQETPAGTKVSIEEAGWLRPWVPV
jgi:hypothetical protein